MGSKETKPERPSRPKPLSAREVGVLKQIADGMSTREIAESLGLSIKTIETHRAAIMRKLGIFNVAQLTKYAIRHRITTLYA